MPRTANTNIVALPVLDADPGHSSLFLSRFPIRLQHLPPHMPPTTVCPWYEWDHTIAVDLPCFWRLGGLLTASDCYIAISVLQIPTFCASGHQSDAAVGSTDILWIYYESTTTISMAHIIAFWMLCLPLIARCLNSQHAVRTPIFRS